MIGNKHSRPHSFATQMTSFFHDPSFEKLFIHTIMITAQDTIEATAKMNTIRKKGAKWSVRIGHSMNIISSRVPLHTIDCPSHSCSISWHFTTPLLVGAPNLQGGRTKTKFTKLWQSATYRLPSSGQIG